MAKWTLPLLLGILLSGSMNAHADVTFTDPRGDDKGHGDIVYPTGKVYKPGSFDLVKLEIKDDGEDVIFMATFAAKILDPWKSKEWDGNGFSLQYVQVYLHSKEEGGHTQALPGMNVQFSPQEKWHKVVLLSPQGKSRLRSEINTKAAAVKGDVVIPRTTKARGKTIRAVVSKKDLGGTPTDSWGYQALVQSNEGYPKPEDLLTRKVNEFQGEHRFGGGNDWECDAHVLDLLMPPSSGSASKTEGQFRVLQDFCGGDGMRDKSDGKLATVPMVYPTQK